MTRGHTLTQGLFDIQINGFAGVDFNDADRICGKSLDDALEAMLACGVTSCLPTLISASPDLLRMRFRALDDAVHSSRLGPAMVPGYHLEGPFLNPADGYAGCHPPQAMCAPDANIVKRLEHDLWLPILLVTYAPELDAGEVFAKTMHAAGKLLAIGHSAADIATVERAARAGARLSTHLGNGVPQTLHKLNNTIFAQSGCDTLSASFIADGLHVPPPALKTLLRAKGAGQAILVTDAVSAAAVAQPGIYPFAGMRVERSADGSVRVPGSSCLAGSSLTLDRAIRNVTTWGLASFEEALAMASDNPRRLLAPALMHHRMQLLGGEVEWSEAMEIMSVCVGEHRRSYRP